MPRRRHDRPVPTWMGDLEVHERRLDNGLLVLALSRRQTPAVVCDLYYLVGSADEPSGRTGLAHYLEHMLFKGTERFPKGAIDRLAFEAAGHVNAETGRDSTHYWFASPSDGWPIALEIEADRMIRAVFDPEEVEAERRVIAEEWAGDQDSPAGRLIQEHQEASYPDHPYGHPILGWPKDRERIRPSDLERFYQCHYRPEGSVLVLVGDLDPEEALDRAADAFQDLGRVDELPDRPFATSRKGSSGRRRRSGSGRPGSGRREFRHESDDAVLRAVWGWHTVGAGDPASATWEVVADILSVGWRSRLWSEVVEQRRLATWIEAYQETSRCGGQLLIQLEAVPGVSTDELDRAITEVLADLAERGPTPEELTRSRRRLEADWRWEQEDLAGLAAGLGDFAVLGDWRDWQAEHRRALEVRADAVAEAVASHLTWSSAIVGWSLPRSGPSVVVAPTLPTEPSAMSASRGLVGQPRTSQSVARESNADWPEIRTEDPKSSETRLGPSRTLRLTRDWYCPTSRRLDNGLTLITERRGGSGVLALDLCLDAGVLLEEKPGLAYVTGRMLEEGFQFGPRGDLAVALEDIGGYIEIGGTGVSIRIPAEELPLALEILNALVLRPAWLDDHWSWVRRRTIAEWQADWDDPAYQAEVLFRHMIYGRSHPYGRDPRGTPAGIGRLTRALVRAHHQRHAVPERSALVIVGDFEPRALRRAVDRSLAGWSSTSSLPTRSVRRIPPRRAQHRRIDQPNEQVQCVLGHLGIRRDDPDFDALSIVDQILGGGPGFTDRLSRVVRDELGLVYAIGGGITETADREPGLFRIAFGTHPDRTVEALRAIREQIALVHEGRFPDEEVIAAQRYLAGAWVFDFQTVAQRAEMLDDLWRCGRDLNEPRERPERIARITAEQVRDAAARHLHPDRLGCVELGPGASTEASTTPDARRSA